jgi:hypothetical protein
MALTAFSDSALIRPPTMPFRIVRPGHTRCSDRPVSFVDARTHELVESVEDEPLGLSVSGRGDQGRRIGQQRLCIGVRLARGRGLFGLAIRADHVRTRWKISCRPVMPLSS